MKVDKNFQNHHLKDNIIRDKATQQQTVERRSKPTATAGCNRTVFVLSSGMNGRARI